MGNGISSRIITHKYIKNMPLVEWIRARKFNVSGTSYFWNGFIRIMSWITGQLGWKVGNGSNIRVGVDPIAGLNTQYLLSEDLREYVTNLGITNLAQEQNLDVYGHAFNCWYSVSDLNLGGRLGCTMVYLC